MHPVHNAKVLNTLNQSAEKEKAIPRRMSILLGMCFPRDQITIVDINAKILGWNVSNTF